MQLEGIHHISAITADAPRNVDFYARVLGLRLVAKTVNQDDPGVYHLFYGDEDGSPGAELTFFEYPGLPQGRPGSGMVHRIVLRVGSAAALDFWQERLGGEGVPTERASETLRFLDPEGLGHELAVSDANPPLTAFHPEVPAEHAIGGIVGVRAYGRAPAVSGAHLESLLGAAPVSADTWELRGRNRGGTISFDPPPEARALQGAGTVHHVAWGTSVAEHPSWHGRLAAARARVTPVIDRYFFHSIYWREPSGVLYEIADDGPGFTRDMPRDLLGTRIVLPSWLERHREAVEARLTPLPDPRATWPAHARS